jgi:hypothetical protein
MKKIEIPKSGEWTEPYDGIRARYISIEQVKAEYPKLSDLIDEILPITTQTLLNGNLMRLEQFPILKGYFGDGFTKSKIRLFYQKNHFDFTITNWDEVCDLIDDVESRKRLSGEKLLYAIEKKPGFWNFHYLGKSATVKTGKTGLKALPMIEILLRNQNKVYTATSLRSLGSGLPVFEKSAQEQLDDPKVVRDSISRLEADYEKAKEYEKDGIQKQIDCLKKYLKISMNKKGRSRSISDNDKDRVAVVQNFKTLLSKIEPQNRELYNHFNTYLKIGSDCRYCPDKEIFWEIS